MEDRSYEDLLQEIEVYKQAAELSKRDAESMRTRIQEINKYYFKANDEIREVKLECDVVKRDHQNIREIFPTWFDPETVLINRINLYELQIKVLKDRVKELEN